MKHVKPVFFAILFGLVCSANFADASTDTPVSIEVGSTSATLSNVCIGSKDAAQCIKDVVLMLQYSRQQGRTEAYCERYISNGGKDPKYLTVCSDMKTNVEVQDLYNWIGEPK